jgi:hypothetical protein
MVDIQVAGRAGISQARTRLGVEPVMCLHDEVVKPIAYSATMKYPAFAELK